MARLACGVRAAADDLALFNAWAGDGTWDKVLIAIQGEQHAAGQLEWTVSVDSTIARAHQHAAGARKDTTGGFVELQESGARTR